MLKRIKNKLVEIRRIKLAMFFAKFKGGGILYYSIFSKAFNREHTSVLAGKAKYLKREKEGEGNYYLLVRNIHRIEKGLLMVPRRETFAAKYISETVAGFISIKSNRIGDENTDRFKWFNDVLVEYFKATNSSLHENILESRKIFYAHCDDTKSDKLVPYKRGEEKITINYDSFYELSRRRRSVRWFTSKKVPRELIDKALLVALQSPSACNRQPFEYRIIDDEELLDKVVKIPMGTSGYSHSIKVMIVCVGNLDAYFDERDRHLIYIDSSLANMSLMYALETLGLASCPINWPDIESKEVEMANLLDLEVYQRPIMCIGLGYPAEEGLIAYSAKESLDQIRKFN
ncbi:nitroreductase family protein [Neolewinella persica]|uniref:nitroreductase family protein n=1 Tax=Neolewinella persica TaxID=70998 RepID=UPI0003667BB0|nr:nitroreductase family protein [Neolewinella persica]